MKLIFMGTPDFAVPCLRRLVADGHEIVLAVTQPDKPVGRKQILSPSAVKQCALSLQIPVYQPASLRTDEAYDRLAACGADAIVVVAFGKILPQRILDMTRYGCINVHGSLLPKYRGAAPIQWAVINGDRESGVTTMRLDAGVDTGDILLTSRRPLDDEITGGELFDLLAADGAELLSSTLAELEAGRLQPVPQPAEGASYAAMLNKTMSPLDWRMSAKSLHDQVRGMNPWPVATCRIGDGVCKVFRSAVAPGTGDHAPGTVVGLHPLAVACGDGNLLLILELQADGSKRMAAEDYLRGHALPVGTVLTA